MQRIIQSILLITLFWNSHHAHAYEVRNVCAKYQTNYSWSNSQFTTTQIYKGDELNRTTGNPYFGNYEMFSHYALIWWEQGQVSVIKLDYYFGGMLLNARGVDQNGRQWELSDTTAGYCF